ncbi:ABC transporter substrate-binding protein [Ralstonia pseudosolanacearum]|uniref:Putative abc-type branched-chain amino acid transport systems, periplasmic component signal peptide protein n=1 Tax=Ralstonia solanacearum TaxID=305 RepID=A0A0S4WK56_RALSL|nr:ABC transporter substrate-binding protein [Ralstonia pseudosolanacearum]CUV46734.1 putative abc-type branched-chain amino acid transport systems, periplasmic component signal peptide protein [Ralstonia solanacearum]MDO3523686.1 ABC transporter substrate-binding protein [Ralstonia pseudosolanacearum]MDO3549427.1 ABC transporter substrate-binding protein [Ralstonia pseudosolanacearum]MDO3554721.1 ABC transporter substrate-binding protein [Ralstonia pseudosolanacearum]MDO3569289.1 ABC transpor
MWKTRVRGGLRTLHCAVAMVALTAHAQSGPPLVVGQLTERGGAQADFARDFMAGAKVAFDAANQAGGIRGRRITLVRREVDVAEAVPQAVELIERDHVEVLFGVSERLLSALAATPEIVRRDVPLLAPLSGATSSAGNVWFTRPDYDSEIVAAHNRLRQFGMRRIALVTAASFDPQLGARLRSVLASDDSAETLDLYTLTGDPGDLAARIAPTKPTAVIVAGDTLAYASVGRALAQRGWYGFLVGLSSVNPQVAREILGNGYSGGMLLAQTVPNPAGGGLKITREHIARMKQFLDEPPSTATLSGYIAASFLIQAISAAGGKASGPELRRALQTRVDLGGFTLDFTKGNRGSAFVDLNYIQGTSN